MSVQVDLQVAGGGEGVPGRRAFRRWAAAALAGRGDAELCIRIVGAAEGRRLNRRYRGSDRATNVLAFPAELPAEIGLPVLGDLVICHEVVATEAREQGKEPEAHWAHLVVHGTLHLLGFDHQNDAEAAAMERREMQILEGLGYADPYAGERRSVDEPVRVNDV